MTHVHRLSGFTTTPLATYLAAIGVLRIVGDQIDDGATGHWEQGEFVLTTTLEADELLAFLLDDYRPTPVVSPWNGGSGFHPKDQRRGIDALAASKEERLGTYRSAIRAAADVLEEAGPENESWKERVVEMCRARLPDEAVGWLDAAVVLTDEGPKFPPVLGTGGNDGRLEFSNNFMQRVVQVLDLPSGDRRSSSVAWLRGALWASERAPRDEAAIGQFEPGAVGGVNAATVGEAASLVNPWTYVLMIEGTLLLASATARRMGVVAGPRAAAPFTVRPSPVGFATASKEQAKGELWLPVWRRPTGVRELARLFGEGRADWNGRPATTGLDFARAAASLGVDRGIDAFERYAILQRSGRSMLAVTVGRIRVTDRPEVLLARQLDTWLDKIRRGKEPPASVETCLRRVERALFELAARGGRGGLHDVLAAAAELEGAVGRASGFRARSQAGPVPWLTDERWGEAVREDTSEFRVAAGLASLRDRDGRRLRYLLTAVGDRDWRDDWGDPLVDGFLRRPLVDVLADALVHRTISPPFADSGAETTGLRLAWEHGSWVSAADVADFALGLLDDDRIERLLSALMLLRRPAPRTLLHDGRSRPVPALAVVVPFFHGLTPAGTEIELAVRPSWAALLRADRVESVLAEAIRWLRIAGLRPAVNDPAAIARCAPPGPRLAAAVQLKMPDVGLHDLLRAVAPPELQVEGAELVEV